jgi:transposase
MSNELTLVHDNAAGIDVGSTHFFVDAGANEVVNFPTYTEGCHSLRDYLLRHKIKTVAMESTGVYWVILHGVLEEAGIDVFLVNGRDVKNVPGRKSDVKDCQWLRQLHSYGLLRKSFIPPENIRSLREYMRVRQDHIRAQATQTRLIQKALTLMNIRLTEAINDVMGASGSRIIASILEGEREPEVLITYCHKSILTKKRDLVLKSLHGEYRSEHLFALRQAHRTWYYYQTLIEECDVEVGALLSMLSINKSTVDITEKKRKPIRYNKPKIEGFHNKLLQLTDGKDPTGIAGITDYGFLQIVSELGLDLQAWPSEKHFVSWLKLAPMHSASGKTKRKVNSKRANNASLIFRQIAQGILTSKHLALGSFGRRIKAKRGSGVAIKAIARKIASYYYRVITKGETFFEQGIKLYEQQFENQRKNYLIKQAAKLGMRLVPVDS